MTAIDWTRPDVQRITPGLRERFYALVDVHGPDDCWEWLGCRTPLGYGHFGVRREDGKWAPRKAHRIALELEGVDLAGLQANHHCDNPGCVNPRHLYAGTQVDNMEDQRRRGRRPESRPPRNFGETNGAARLTAEQVAEIRRLRAAGRRAKGDLDQQFGVNRRTINKIVNRETWAHV